jgi:hypothetical protein
MPASAKILTCRYSDGVGTSVSRSPICCVVSRRPISAVRMRARIGWVIRVALEGRIRGFRRKHMDHYQN